MAGMEITAMAARSQGATLEPFRCPSPELGPQDCLVRVAACGICHSDVHMIDDDWRISRYPLVPGHEVVGTVVRAGSSLRHLQPGDRVGVGWQRSACMHCLDCLRGDENLCDEARSLIGDGHGGFADHLVVDGRFAFPLPAALSDEAAGPLLCGGATVYSALRHAGMSSGQEIGVIGVGGLGHLAVQFAAKLGNRVTVFTTSEDKARDAERLGAREAVVIRGGKVPERLASRLDILLSTAPAALDWNAYVNLLDSDGVLAFVAASAPAKIRIDALMFKRRRVAASVIAGRAEITEMLDLAARHAVAPIVEAFPLAEANAAIRKVRDNTVRYRAVLKVA
jgi:uncharacterized zinc-type alcohol dehydrogenase-like protein